MGRLPPPSSTQGNTPPNVTLTCHAHVSRSRVTLTCHGRVSRSRVTVACHTPCPVMCRGSVTVYV
eukprot:1233672-Amorphochlora_amoeboformis.AAC.1